MRILIAFSLLVISNPFVFSQKDTSNFISFLKGYKSGELPFYTYLINSDKEFQLNIKKSRIDDKILLKYFIKDSSDLGYKYSTHAMDNYNVIMSGYIKYRYYLYKWLKFNESYYFVIYVFENEDESKTLLTVFNSEGIKLSSLILSEEILGVSFTESCVGKNFIIKKVIYSKAKDATIIQTNTLKFNNKSCFEIFSGDTKEGKVFYYDFKKHNLLEDPLRLPEVLHK